MAKTHKNVAIIDNSGFIQFGILPANTMAERRAASY